MSHKNLVVHNTRHVKVFNRDHEQITKKVDELQMLFFEKASACEIIVRKTGKHTNIPGQPNAVECIISGLQPEQYIDQIIERFAPRSAAKQTLGAATKTPNTTMEVLRHGQYMQVRQ